MDDPAVREARYLIAKRRDSGSTPDTVTDTTPTHETDENLSVLERIGKSVMDLLGGQPADANTRVRLAAGIAKAAGATEDVEKGAEPETVEKKKCPGCGRFMSAESRHRDSDDKEKSAEASEASEDEAEKSAEPEEAEAEEQEAEKASESEAEAESEEQEAEKASESEDPNAALIESIKSMLETELAPLRESIGKAATADAVSEIGERVETLEKRKGISRVAKGADIESDDSGESVFGDVIFGG